MFGKSYDHAISEKEDIENPYSLKGEFCKSQGSDDEESTFAKKGVKLDRYNSQIISVGLHYSKLFKTEDIRSSYVIGNELGRGRYGIVKEAYSKSFHTKKYAVKLIW